jgi:hypothetical protein
MTYRFRFTLDSYGDAEEHAEQFVDAFAETHPEVGAVVSQNTEEGTLSIVFSLDAKDHDDAIDKARPVFIEAATATKLEPAGISEMMISRVAGPRKRQPRARKPVLQPC